MTDGFEVVSLEEAQAAYLMEVGQLSEERRQWIEDFQHARDSTDEVLASCVECYGDADSPNGHAPGCRVPRLIAKDRLR